MYFFIHFALIKNAGVPASGLEFISSCLYKSANYLNSSNISATLVGLAIVGSTVNEYLFVP
jgi:hypothetical protein